MQETKWIVAELPAGAGPVTGSDRELPPILRVLLAQRGFDSDDQLEPFLRPRLRELRDPFELPEMDLAVQRILEAVDSGERICVFGDYDVDGITSVAILSALFSAYGVEVQTFIPIRGKEGYGLSDTAIERCLAAEPRPSLLVTVDCGTASGKQIERLAEEGIDVIVADHHETGAGGRPPAVAVVNPKLGDDYGYLCSAGVVFKLAHALLRTRQIENVDSKLWLREVLDLVAVATVADIVPLVEENRLLVRHGLQRLSQTSNHGLRALMEVSGMNGHATSSDVGFRIGQRIEREMHEQARAELKRQGFDEALDPVIVLGSRDWHPGVVGILASRLMRHYHKPAFVISFNQSDGEDGLGKGSGRSIAGVSLVHAIEACRSVLESGGGHHMAAGISLHEDKLKEFHAAFGDYVLNKTTAEDRKPSLHIDAEIPLEELSLGFLSSYELLQPFGSGNPQPVFMSRGVWPTESPRQVGTNHMRLSLRQGIQEKDAIYFGGWERDLPDPPWDVAFTIDRNLFRGRVSLQVSVKDIRCAE